MTCTDKKLKPGQTRSRPGVCFKRGLRAGFAAGVQKGEKLGKKKGKILGEIVGRKTGIKIGKRKLEHVELYD